MKTLLIDDDRMFSDALRVRLVHEGLDVVYCQTVDEVLNGWYEINVKRIDTHTREMSKELEQVLRGIAELRFATSEDLAHWAARHYSNQLTTMEEEQVLTCVSEINPLAVCPQVIVLDMMMPTGRLYSGEQSDHGRCTGRLLLRDIIKKYPDVPVLVVTVHRDEKFHNELRAEFGTTIKGILTKPATPSMVVNLIKESGLTS